MGEGETPTAALNSVAPTAFGKLESLNPTASFKDRGSSVIASSVVDESTPYEGIVVASTGNTATSVAAYAARARIACAVLVPQGTGTAKLSQVAAHGVSVFAVDGTFSDCFSLADTVAEDDGLVNATAIYSANPYVAAANRSVAFEIVARLGEAPDWVTVPVGAGPLLGGTHRGFEELAEAGLVKQVPKMVCVQAHGCHPIVRAFETGASVEPWDEPITTEVGAIADPLRGYSEDGDRTLASVRESGGVALALDDETVFEWQTRLASVDGVYAEPASAASVAAINACESIEPSDSVVALVTGHGLKEPAETDVAPTPVAGADEVRDTLLGE
ncbi:threonine synthase [Natronococcus pandeyae]|uniref:Threonine synthase n=2 Tax=Natronococcus pandeyae TaxID=2055836 RepID=A0A8J8Q0I5_9EURY|nr:threonine synthase [Natronococcus pandeyae]